MEELIKQLDATLEKVYNFVSKIVDEFKARKSTDKYLGRSRGRR